MLKNINSLSLFLDLLNLWEEPRILFCWYCFGWFGWGGCYLTSASGGHYHQRNLGHCPIEHKCYKPCFSLDGMCPGSTFPSPRFLCAHLHSCPGKLFICNSKATFLSEDFLRRLLTTFICVSQGY